MYNLEDYNDIVQCPFCGSQTDIETCEAYGGMCLVCGADILEEEGREEQMKNFKDYWTRWKEEENEETLYGLEESVFVFRFMTPQDSKTVAQCFESLSYDVVNIEIVKNGPISKFIETQSGKKLLKGFELKEDDLIEYVVELSCQMGVDNEEEKKMLISTICESFPLVILREEGSRVIMANNKGLAKGYVDLNNEDQEAMLGEFLSWYEKYKLMCNYLFWISPYKEAKAADILIKWSNSSLISLETLRSQKENIPAGWQKYLSTIDGVDVSLDDKDSGSIICFETMIEDVFDREERVKNAEPLELKIISLRGTKEYSLG